MKNVKRLLSLFLVLVLCLSFLPAQAFADDDTHADLTTNNIDLTGATSLGSLITRSVENAEETDGYGLPGSVTDIQITDRTATVEYSADREAELVVAVYEEDGIRMLASGHTAVSTGNGTAEVTIEIDAMPEFFVLGVYLLDALTNEPLCEQYISRYYTEAFQRFLEKDISDYDPELVVNLDDRTDTNFVVFSEDVLVAREGDASNQITDNGNGTYLVINPDDSFLSLSTGDSFSYMCADGALLIVVVQSVEQTDNGLLIVEKQDAELADVFDYVKIEATNENVAPEIDTANMGEGVTLEAVDGVHTASVGGDGSLGTSLSFNLERGVIKGSLEFGVEIELKYYVSLDWRYISFKTEFSTEVNVGFSGKLAEIDIPLAPLKYPLIPGIVDVGMTPSFVAEASVAFTLSCGWGFTLGFEYDSNYGRVTSLCKGPGNDNVEITLTGKVFVGIKVDPGATVISTKFGQAAMVSKVGLEAVSKNTLIEEEADDSTVHDCELCFAGTLSAVASSSYKLKLSTFVNMERELWSLNLKIDDFYIQLGNPPEFGWGKCPNIRYKVTAMVKDEHGQVLNGVHLKTPSLHEEKLTDDSGKAVFYLPNGQHVISASQGEYFAVKRITVNDMPTKAGIELVMDHGDKIAGDAFGSDLAWALYEDGTLRITGFGTMPDYEDELDVPWHQWQKDIKTVAIAPDWTIEDGTLQIVENIGKNAFNNCTNLELVNLADGISSIGDFAFYNCSSLSTIVIPSSLVEIGEFTFSGCSSLMSIDLPGSLSSVGEFAFSNCKALTEITIPSQVKEVADSMLLGCSSLERISLPVSLERIGNAAFESCGSLTNIIIPNTVTELGSRAFCSCDRLESIGIPVGITRIEAETFSGCTALTQALMNNNVTFIGDRAFADCKNLSNTAIPLGVTAIGKAAFRGCSTLTLVAIPENVTVLAESVFSGCTSLKDVKILGNLTSIEASAFEDCIAITELSFPESLTRIGDGAFSGNRLLYIYYSESEDRWNAIQIGEDNDFSDVTLYYDTIAHEKFNGEKGAILTWKFDKHGTLTISGVGSTRSYNGYPNPSVPPWSDYLTQIESIVVESGITGLGQKAFGICSARRITLPETVQYIQFLPNGAGQTFTDCDYLETITVNSDNPYYSSHDGILYDKSGSTLLWYPRAREGTSFTVPDHVTTIGDLAFLFSQLSEITVPGTVIEIRDQAFVAATIQKITLLEGVRIIRELAFNWSNIESIDLPDSIQHIEESAFINCSKLIRARWSSNTTTITKNAFSNCGALTSISIPVGVTKIDNGAFAGCVSLTDVFYEGTESQWNEITVGEYNEELLNATIHYNSTGPDDVGTMSLEQEEITDPEELPEVEEPAIGTEPAAEPEFPADPEPIQEAGEAVEIPDSPAEPKEYADEPEPDDEPEEEEPEENKPEIKLMAAYSPALNDGNLASFRGLVPEAAYVLLVTADTSVPASLTADNLLYIAQAYADGAGNLNLSYVPREDAVGAAVRLFGASDKNLKDAEIIVEQFSDGSFVVKVYYEGTLLTEGKDYLLVLEQTDATVTVTVRGRDVYSGKKTVIGNKYPPGSATVSLGLLQNYLMLHKDETFKIEMLVEPAVYGKDLEWAVENGDGIVTVDQNGNVTAGQPGTATVAASVTVDDRTYTARCRVDVADETEQTINRQLEVNGIRLVSSKVTVELFRTDYTRVEIIPELTQNLMAMSNENEQGTSADRGASIESARFEKTEVDGLFLLRVADDRSLEIVPRNETLLTGEVSPNKIKGSYQSEVLVKVNGEEYPAGILTMTVKKSLPSIKAKAVKLNSYLTDVQGLTFIGGTVTAAEPVSTKPAPDWMMYLEDSSKVAFTGPQSAKKSGKLELLATVDGWAVKRPVTVSVSAAPTSPKLSFRSSTLTVKPGTNDAADTTVTVSPAEFRNPERYPITLENITEGSGKTLKTYELGTVLQCSLNGSTLTVEPGPELTDGKAHSFKVWLSVGGKQTAVTVKALAEKTAVSVQLKTAGGIDLTIPNSSVTVTAGTGNYHTEQAVFSVKDIVKAKSTESVLDQFEIEPVNGRTLCLKAGAGLEAGSYTVTVQADCGGGTIAEKTTGITVKRSEEAKVKPSVTLKLSGKIDVLRPGTSVTVTPVIRNWFLYEFDENNPGKDLVFYRKTGSKFDEITDPDEIPFDVELGEGQFVLTRKAPINHKTDIYGVGMRFDAGESRVSTLKPVTIGVTMGKTKILQSAKALTLIRNDKNSSAILHLIPEDAQQAIAVNGVTLDAKSAKLFDLRDLGGGYYEISYLNGQQTTTKATTVKLNVKLAGNETAVSNASVSVKINIQ